MKRFGKVLISLCMILNSAISVSAEEKQYVDESPAIQSQRISAPMTFDEMVEYYMDAYSVSWMTAYSELGGVKAEAEALSSGNSTRVLSVPFSVNGGLYVPKIDFYCNTSEGTSSWGILSIYSTHLNREYLGTYRRFSGTIEEWLKNSYSIEYIIDGDWYTYGSQTSGYLSGTVNIGGYGYVTFGISGAETYYANTYIHKTKVFQG